MGEYIRKRAAVKREKGRDSGSQRVSDEAGFE